MHSRWHTLAQLGGSLVVLAGCAGGDGNSIGPSEDVVGGCERLAFSGTLVFPDATLMDWVSFADHVAAVEVIEEARIPPPPEVIERHEGYVGRNVAVRVIETIWSNAYASPLDTEFAFNGIGWFLKEGCPDMVPGHYVDGESRAPRLEVRGKYVMAIVRFTTLADAWASLTPGAVFAMESDPVATEDVETNGNDVVAQELAGQSFDAIRALLDGTPPHSSVKAWLHLPAEERLARASSN